MKKILLLAILFSGYSISAKYTICEEFNAVSLSSCVNIALKNGFEPHGPLNIYYEPIVGDQNMQIVRPNKLYTQALYKD